VLLLLLLQPSRAVLNTPCAINTIARRGYSQNILFVEPWTVSMDSLTALEFYSGIGGMHCALKTVVPTATVLDAFDINHLANYCYKHNFGKAPNQVILMCSSYQPRPQLSKHEHHWHSQHPGDACI
jgi:hypothetical protein